MQRNVKNITDDQIAAVVEYISTLSGEEPPDTVTDSSADSTDASK